MAIDGRTHRTKFRDQVVKPLLEQDWLEMTLPQSPRSPQQKYRLTEQGQVLLDEQAKGKKMIRDPIAANLRPDIENFSHALFEQKGGLGKVHWLLGAELPTVIETLNRELAA